VSAPAISAPEGGFWPLGQRVGAVMTAPPLTCGPDTAIDEAARLMAAQRAGSIVVVDGVGRALGIVTDTDLRTRVVAARCPADAPVRAIMSAPALVIGAGEPAFDAFLLMLRHGIHHLLVEEGGQLLGIVSSHDLLWLEGGHPVALARHLEAQQEVAGLRDTARRLAAVARWLVAGGTGALAAGRVVAELHDALVRRVVDLAQSSLAREGHVAPPVPISWIAAGSEGRREQALATDQDNGIVYADPPPGQAEAAARYVQALAARVAEGLEHAGVPRCPGGYMATNPRWCQPLRVWREYAEAWTDAPTGQHLLDATTYADLRPVAGDPAPGEALARQLVALAAARPVFLRHMARDALQRSAGLGLFGRFAVERHGPHQGRVDLKGHGLFPVAQVIRVHALAAGLAETNTVDRLRALAGRGVFSAEEVRDVADAYEVMARLRLRHQLACLDAGESPDNHVDPRTLSRADRLLLRDAFRVVAWLQRSAEDRFQTATVS